MSSLFVHASSSRSTPQFILFFLVLIVFGRVLRLLREARSEDREVVGKEKIRAVKLEEAEGKGFERVLEEGNLRGMGTKTEYWTQRPPTDQRVEN